MKKLYIFAVGGTGSRVLKAFTMLIAAGIKAENGQTFQVVPIIIDPHSGNLDFQQTNRLLENYMAIATDIGVDNGFFGTAISTLRDLNPAASRLPSTFTYGLKKVLGAQFKEYIGYRGMNEANQGLAEVLFSGDTVDKRNKPINLLDIEMDIGFIGNPNIGSVVLNQFKDSQEFKEFASSFTDQDRVFVISSIFGGTGAAGFPIIVKNIRNAMMNSDIDGRGYLRRAKIGALTVLPYFNIAPDPKSPIQKSVFIAKTKAALSYYETNMHGSVDIMYYISDELNGKAYKNDPGNGGQKNDAHFVELAAALSIFDYMGIRDDQFSSENGQVLRPVYKEFGVKEKTADMRFVHLEDQTRDKIRTSLAQLVLFNKYLQKELRNTMDKQPFSIDAPKINAALTDQPFYNTHLTEFLEGFMRWLREMSDNKKAFSPFLPEAELNAIIPENPAKTPWYWFSKFKYAHINSLLNAHSKKGNYSSERQKLVHLFYHATKDTLRKFYKINS